MVILVRRNLSLKELHAQVVATLRNDAPAYVTIKRLSAGGAFNDMTLAQAAAYLKKRAKKPTSTAGQSSPPAVKPDSPQLGGSVSDGIQVDQVQRLRLELAKAMAEIGKLKQEIETARMEERNAVAQLSGVRTTLMTKYDAVCAQQLQTIETLRAQIKDLQQNMTLVMEVGRMRTQLQRLADSMAKAS